MNCELAVCSLFVELRGFEQVLGCGNKTAASCGENEMLHEAQRLPEDKDNANR